MSASLLDIKFHDISSCLGYKVFPLKCTWYYFYTIWEFYCDYKCCRWGNTSMSCLLPNYLLEVITVVAGTYWQIVKSTNLRLMLIIACQFKVSDSPNVSKTEHRYSPKALPTLPLLCSYGHQSPFGVRLQCKKACFKYSLRFILKAAREAQRILAGKQPLTFLLKSFR